MLYFIFLWVVPSIFIAFLALNLNKSIGMSMVFFISLFFSPLVGIVAVFTSRDNDDIEREKETLNLLKKMASEGNDELNKKFAEELLAQKKHNGK
jgi:hypothetical protein